MVKKTFVSRVRLRAFALIAVIALANLALVGVGVWFMSGAAEVALAQDKDEVEEDDGGVRFDRYPHPATRGALRYSLGDSWNRTDLTFYFHNCPSTLDCDTGHQAVRAGFNSWSQASRLRFTEVNDPRQADIELMWTTQTPELGTIGEVLAFAFFPRDGGDVFFDDSEPWSAFDGSQFDLYLTATHEIGHALGLDHSRDPYALMYPVLTGATQGLAQDDVAAIQALYGSPQAGPDDDNDQDSGFGDFQDVPQSGQQDFIELSGSLDDQQPYEVWEIGVEDGETVEIIMSVDSGQLDPYIGVLTADQSAVLAETDSSDGQTAQLTYTFVEGGTYLVVATRNGVEDGVGSGSYTLTLESLGVGEVPPVDDFEDAPADDGVEPEVVPAGDVLVTLRSYSPEPLCELYLSPTESDEWGANLLDDTLSNGNFIDLAVESGLYDVLAVNCAGDEIEEYEIEVRSDLEIEIYEDEINVYVYAF